MAQLNGTEFSTRSEPRNSAFSIPTGTVSSRISNLQLGVNFSAGVIAPGAGGSAQASAMLNYSRTTAWDHGVVITIQVAGGVGGGGYAGVGPGVQGAFADSVSQNIFSMNASNYAELNGGAGFAASGSAAWNNKGNWSAAGGGGKAGFVGAGAFVGKQGQIAFTFTGNTLGVRTLWDQYKSAYESYNSRNTGGGW